MFLRNRQSDMLFLEFVLLSFFLSKCKIFRRQHIAAAEAGLTVQRSTKNRIVVLIDYAIILILYSSDYSLFFGLIDLVWVIRA